MESIAARLVRDPPRTGLFLDFDGTLSHIVDIPSAARPVQGVRGVLAQLHGVLGVVAIVSGRSAVELVEWLGSELEIWGVHGVERNVKGSIEISDRAQAHEGLMSRVRADAQRRMDELGIEGIILEDKGVMVGLHYRAAEDLEQAGRALAAVAADLADSFGVVASTGKLAFEMRPPMEQSKAMVVLERARAAELRSVAFIGDDVVDLPGFDALDELARDGLETLRIAVDSDEAPAELIERADLVVDGPAGVLEFLGRVASSLGLQAEG